MGTIKDRNVTDLSEVEDMKKNIEYILWQEELYKKKFFMTQITTMAGSLT